MIKHCDHPGCSKAGIYRAPKSRDSQEYWMFCRAHAAEYNKNWNYYNGMTPEEIQTAWHEQVYGISQDSKQDKEYIDYSTIINDFVNGNYRHSGTKRSKISPDIVNAFATLGLPVTATYREVGMAYRALAKKNHPDTSPDQDSAIKFSAITVAYDTLKKYFTSKKK